MRTATSTYQCSCQNAKSVSCSTKSGEKNRNIFTKKRTHLIWTIGNSRKETAKRLNRINNNFYFSLPFPPMVPPSSPLCLTKGEETLPNNTNLSCKVCTFSLCCVPFTSENSLQVKFSQILNEWTQTADHRALQGGYTWKRAAAWGGHGNTNMEFSQAEAHRRYSKTQ